MFDWVPVMPLAGPLKDIHRVVLKPLLCFLGCVLRVIVLLEGEPSVQSEVLRTLDQVFKDISVLCSIQLSPSTLTSCPVPAAEKHPHSMMLPTPTNILVTINKP